MVPISISYDFISLIYSIGFSNEFCENCARKTSSRKSVKWPLDRIGHPNITLSGDRTWAEKLESSPGHDRAPEHSFIRATEHTPREISSSKICIVPIFVLLSLFSDFSLDLYFFCRKEISCLLYTSPSPRD